MKDQDIRENIKNLRKEKGYTQQDMADLLEVDRNTYRGVEAGKTKILNPLLGKISKILGISLINLLAGLDLDMEELHSLEEMKVNYQHKVQKQENDYIDQVRNLQLKLDQKEMEIHQLQSWLEDKSQIIALQKKQLESCYQQLNRVSQPKEEGSNPMEESL